MFPRALVSLVSLIALVAFAVCSQAQNIPYSQRDTPSRFATRTSGIVNVTGTIHSLDNKPLQDVKIELHDISNGGMVDSVYTNASGTFEFPQVRSGSYEVVAISGLNETKERIEINSIPVMVNMRLPVTTKPTDGNNINVVSVAEYKVPEKARKEMRKAEDAASQRNSAEAEKHVAKALEIYPKYSAALTLRAFLKLDTKDQAGAIDDLQKAIEYDGSYGLAYVGMGAALNAAKKFDEAIRTLERAQSLMPNAWQTYYEMGKSFLGKASYQEAVRQFDKAESLVPQEFALVHLARGSALVGLQQYPEALVELEIFLKMEPQGPNTAYAQKLMEQAKTLSATALNK
jgi:tetratricopeptide (TPR) repeat protein